MAIHFEWYETPVAPGEEDKKKLHPRIALNGRVDTDEMCRDIQYRCSLTDIEIDMRLKEYFASHQMMTRTDFQEICGFLKSKAMEHLRRLKAEGKIQNINIPTQPIYVPVPGYYGVSHDEAIRNR